MVCLCLRILLGLGLVLMLLVGGFGFERCGGCWLSVLGCMSLLFDCGYCDFVACAVNSVDCFDSLSCVLTCCFACADVTICVIVLGFGLR